MNLPQMLERREYWQRLTDGSRNSWALWRLKLRYPGAERCRFDDCLCCRCSTLIVFWWHGGWREWCAVCGESLLEFMQKGGDLSDEIDCLRSPQEGQERQERRERQTG